MGKRKVRSRRNRSRKVRSMRMRGGSTASQAVLPPLRAASL